MIKTPNLIIGAGPAGLGMAGGLRQAGLDFEIVEQSSHVGNSWRNHYDRLHLNTVKQFSFLPHLPLPDAYPTYPSRLQMVDYFDTYAATFKIKPHFKETVVATEKKAEYWIITTQTGKQFQSKNLLVASGITRIPNMPTWKGQDQFKREIIHAKSYKNAMPYKGKKVLVVGLGNTGAELSLDLSEHGCETYLSVRGEVSIVPRDLLGHPVQLSSIQLAKLPFGIGNWLGGLFAKLYLGNLRKYGLKYSKLSPIDFLRTTGKAPILDIGTVQQIKNGKIKIMPEIDCFHETGVTFKNGETKEIDAVLLATGYQAKLDDFLGNIDGFLNRNGLPRRPIGTGQHKNLYFIGFNGLQLYGIFGSIRTDAKTIIASIKDK